MSHNWLYRDARFNLWNYLMNAYVYTLCANFCFALGAITFTKYSNLLGHLWVNKFKAVVAFVLFSISMLFLDQLYLPAGYILILLLASGFLGLGIGDTLILKSFINMGPGRTLLIFGFQPAFIGIFSYFIFDQSLRVGDLIGVVFCIFCLVILSIESRVEGKQFSLKFISIALLGIFFDSIGVIISRYCFEHSDVLTNFNVNFFRIAGAFLAYILLSLTVTKKISLPSGLRRLKKQDLIIITLGSALGTYVSLSFYLKAIQVGNLAIISAVSLTGVLFSSFFECLAKKSLPSKYFVCSFICFLTGMYFVLFL